MSADPIDIADVLNRRFMVDHPLDAARTIEQIDLAEAVEAVKRQPGQLLTPVWRNLLPDTATKLLKALPEESADRVLAELPPNLSVRLLGFMSDQEVTAFLARQNPPIRRDLEGMLSFGPNTAGRVMNTRIAPFRRDSTIAQAIEKIRSSGMTTVRSLFLVDDQQRLSGKVTMDAIALASPNQTLLEIESPVSEIVRPIDPLDDVSRAFEGGRIFDLAVVDIDGVFLGVISHDELVRTIQKDASVDLQTMVGASKDERALSSPFFTVRKRMPWLQINLITAFMAAAVVGIFENTIAQVTALAVLLPVVAGQSGNTGAQALAVTMRGLALREITIRQWGRVLRKEVVAGFLNGIAVAITCGIGVYIWSQSIGLVAVITSSMVLAMIAAGFAGAVIPIVLTRLGQDPATSSSIVLTTVTDIAGFFSFLGIATLMMQFL